MSRIGSWTSCEVSFSGLNCRSLHPISTRKSNFGIQNYVDDRVLDLQAAFLHSMIRQLQQVQHVPAARFLTCIILAAQPAGAVDSMKICACLLKECRVELARCISNPSCAANIACLQSCHDRPAETECQAAMEKFAAKIISMKKAESLFEWQGGPIILSQIEKEFGPPEYDQGDPTKMASTLPIALNVDISGNIAWIAHKDQNARYRQTLISSPNSHGFKSQKKYGRCS